MKKTLVQYSVRSQVFLYIKQASTVFVDNEIITGSCIRTLTHEQKIMNERYNMIDLKCCGAALGHQIRRQHKLVPGLPNQLLM